MLISAIVAVADNNVMGKDNQLPWYVPGDLAYFKRTTLHHCVLMGRSTFQSFGRPLPRRTNIVITRDPYFTADDALVAHSVEEALGLAFDEGEEEAFVLGGAQIFEETRDLWDKLYLTRIHLEPEGDTFFPEIDWSEWREISRDEHAADGKNPCAYTFLVYERVTDTNDTAA
jgi:dihydrofolate reductase